MIETQTPGPWVVDNTLSHHWAIINRDTGRRKVIGPVYQPRSRSKINYFDRAYEEASRRNAVIAKKLEEYGDQYQMEQILSAQSDAMMGDQA